MSHLKSVESPQNADDPQRRDDHREIRKEGGVENEELQGIEGWVLPYLRESTLWPVLVVVIAHIVAFIAPMLLLAFRDLRLGAFGALLVSAYVTFAGVRWEARKTGGLGALSAALGVTWIASFAIAYVADRNSLF